MTYLGAVVTRPEQDFSHKAATPSESCPRNPGRNFFSNNANLPRTSAPASCEPGRSSYITEASGRISPHIRSRNAIALFSVVVEFHAYAYAADAGLQAFTNVVDDRYNRPPHTSAEPEMRRRQDGAIAGALSTPVIASEDVGQTPQMTGIPATITGLGSWRFRQGD
ncbi:hypothetical protein BKA81DRAFT_406094 [Phyllosticta paracitricarpa]